MICAVNLLPESCHAARHRLVRRNAWSVVVLCAGVLVFGTWIALRATDRSVHRLNREHESLQAKQSELDRQLTLAIRSRNELAQRARALTALRQELALPQQLLTLAREAPEGVVLMEIQSLVQAGDRSLASPPTTSPRAGSGTAGAQALQRPGGRGPEPPVVQMTGYAVDHDQLTRLIEALQRIEHWEQIELLRVNREPYLGGMALAFRLECRQAEALQ